MAAQQCTLYILSGSFESGAPAAAAAVGLHNKPMSLEALAEYLACATCRHIVGCDGKVPRRCQWCDAPSCTECVDGTPNFVCGKCGIKPPKWGAAYFAMNIARAVGLSCPDCGRPARPVRVEGAPRPWDIAHAADCPRDAAATLARARGGCLKAALRIAEMYELGVCMPRSERAALQWYLEAARGGTRIAQTKVGTMLWKGRGVDRPHMLEALQWMYLAARGGCAIARHNIGLCLKFGSGVDRDERAAEAWLGDASYKELPAVPALAPPPVGGCKGDTVVQA